MAIIIQYCIWLSNIYWYLLNMYCDAYTYKQTDILILYEETSWTIISTLGSKCTIITQTLMPCMCTIWVTGNNILHIKLFLNIKDVCWMLQTSPIHLTVLYNHFFPIYRNWNKNMYAIKYTVIFNSNISRWTNSVSSDSI